VDLFAVKPEDMNAAGVAELIVDHISTQHGPPVALLSDRGSVFMAELVRAVYKQLGIRKLSTTAYHPQCNGKVERFMQELAGMLAMCASSTRADWHLWLPHVAFSHNSAFNRNTGTTPFMLTTGRQPRLAMHVLLGRLADRESMGDWAPGVQRLVEQLAERQQSAAQVADKRHALRREHVLRENAELERAFGLREVLRPGDWVWYYRDPRTHAVTTLREGATVRERVVFYKKMLDRWDGPWKVLKVGPVWEGPVRVQEGVLYVEKETGERAHVSARLCKLCRDPTRAPPGTLPTGFARYLLARHWRTAPPSGGYAAGAAGAWRSPGSLTLEDVELEGDNHGVEAIVSHRLVQHARGRGRTLEYLVRWRGGLDATEQASSWEPPHLLEVCPELVHDYWVLVDRALQRGAAVEHAATRVVREQLVRARKVRGIGGELARVGRGQYTLARSAVPVPQAPSQAVLEHKAAEGMGILAAYKLTDSDGAERLQWFEGVITSVPEAGGPRGKHRGRFRIFWLTDAKYSVQRLSRARYSTDPAAPEGSWFLFGTAQQCQRLMQQVVGAE
jgi:transposase InsO family protein